MAYCRETSGNSPLILITISVLLLLSHINCFSQGVPSGGGAAGRSKDNFTFVPVPYINYNRSIKLSVGFLPMAMFNPVPSDTLSPSSIAGLLAMYSTNKTWFLMGFGRMYLDADNWRITAGGGLGSINFQFYFDNNIIPYNTGADFIFLEVQRRLFSKLYLGVNYRFMRFETKTDLMPEANVVTHHGIGAILAMDKRSSVYYPYDGYSSNLKFTGFPASFNDDYNSNKIEIEHNQYFPFREKTDVLAARFYGGLGIGDLSFNQQFIVGNRDIRGYSEGEYRGNYIVAAQAEYRWNFHERWGAVGFVGLATVFEAINEEQDGTILPGGGVGLRFNVFPENHMNVGLDIAAGKGDWGIYFKVGEAF